MEQIFGYPWIAECTTEKVSQFLKHQKSFYNKKLMFERSKIHF
jgi:hypothetical protein